MKTYKLYTLFYLAFILAGCGSDSGIAPSNDSSSGLSQGGSTATFATFGDNLYVIDQSNLHTYDVSKENEIVFRNTLSLNAQQLETIFPFDEYLFLGSTTGIYIIDISNPELPRYLSEYQHLLSCDPVVTDGDFAYVTLRSGNRCGQADDLLQILDLSDIGNPTLITNYNLTSPKGLAINGDILYVCDSGIRILDVSDKSNIQELIFIPNIPANDVIYHNNRILVTADDGFYQFDVSYVINIKQIGQFSF